MVEQKRPISFFARYLNEKDIIRADKTFTKLVSTLAEKYGRHMSQKEWLLLVADLENSLKEPLLKNWVKK